MSLPIIDAHVHLFPEDVPLHWERYAARDPWFAALTRKPEDGRGTEEAWATAPEALACAQAAGIGHLVLQGWYWNDPDLMREHNDYMADLVRRYPGRFTAFASINPCFDDQALYEIERCRALGFTGVGELGPGGNGYDFTDPRLFAVLEAAQAFGMPVCIHCGEPVGHAYPGKDLTPLAPLLGIARRLPDLTLILAHQGGGLLFYEVYPEVRAALHNVYYDLAANPLLYRVDSVRRAAALAGSERLLYGSDFPLLLYPSRCREMDFSLFVNDLRENAGLDEDTWRTVMHDNAARLFGLESV